MDLAEFDAQLDPEKHWYYREKFNHIVTALSCYFIDFKDLCDVGAGTAPFSKRLAKIYPDRNFIAVDPNYETDSIGNILEGVRLSHEIVEADIYLLNDVLEHLENPREILQEIKTKARSGSLLIITVPAHMSLWSGHDVYLKHFRRYTKELLVHDLESIVCEITNVKYIFNSLFLPVYLWRKMFGKDKKSQMREFGGILQVIFDTSVKFDHLIKHRTNFGLSILAVVKL
jgi:2-polyprenyl-3-methyl-5-hydroxy-6-metoxy-1,4-benzoquinol methylase